MTKDWKGLDEIVSEFQARGQLDAERRAMLEATARELLDSTRCAASRSGASRCAPTAGSVEPGVSATAIEATIGLEDLLSPRVMG